MFLGLPPACKPQELPTSKDCVIHPSRDSNDASLRKRDHLAVKRISHFTQRCYRNKINQVNEIFPHSYYTKVTFTSAFLLPQSCPEQGRLQTPQLFLPMSGLPLI
jgi:hypothetical protein